MHDCAYQMHLSALVLPRLLCGRYCWHTQCILALSVCLFAHMHSRVAGGGWCEVGTYTLLLCPILLHASSYCLILLGNC